MTKLHYLGMFAALTLLAACGGMSEKVLRVDCGATDVFVTETEAQSILSAMGGDAQSSAIAVCKTFGSVDASNYERPTSVSVKAPSGTEYTAKVQRSLN